MTNQQILEKAIQKAIDGGWRAGTDKAQDIIDWFSGDFKGRMFEECIIFNHDFAKALWGEYEGHVLGYIKDGHKVYGWQSMKAAKSMIVPLLTIPTWQYRLQQMVIADDPIKYLGENI